MTSRFLAITAALVALGAAPAAAQPNAWLGTPASYAADDYRVPYADARRAAHDNGYRDGLKRGERAARDRRALDLERERDYRSADSGYHRNYGDRNLYRDSYRTGFARGYREGYNRRHHGTAGFGAYQNGIRDGYAKAVDDLEDRKYPDARKHKWYREGDHDYDKRYGSRDAYKLEYRRGFLQGYERAYREARR